MGKKGRRRGKAAATGAPEEVAEREDPEASAAAADSATPRKSRRRGRVAQEASTTVHALDPADAGKGTTDGDKKPKLDERKKNKGESSDEGTDGEDVLGYAEVGKKRKRNKKNMQERSSSLVSDDNAIEADKSGILCKNVEDVPGVGEASRPPKNEEVPGSSDVNTAEQEVPKGKKPKLAKRNKNKHELSFSAVVDAAVVVGKSENDSSDGKGVPGVAEISTSPKNGENQDCPEVNIVDKETLERKKPKLRKWKKNKKGRSPAAVSDDGAVDRDKSDNVCTDGYDASRDAQVSMHTVEDPNCPQVNIAEKGTREKKTPKPKKRQNNKEGSPSAVLDTGAVVADESANSSMNLQIALPQDVEASISPRDVEDPTGPGVNIAQKGVPEMKKPKIKKWKKKIQGQFPSALLDAGVVLPDKSGRGDTNVEAASGGADVTTSPRPGEGPQYPDVNVTGHMAEENKVNKDYSQEPKLKKKKKDQSPSAVPDTGAVVADEIGNGYIEGEGLPGDTEISTNPRNGRRPDCPEVNITKDLVEGKNGNNDICQKPKRKKRKRKKRAEVAVIEAPVAVDVRSDERKDVCRTGTMTVSESMGSSICESEVTPKNVFRDIYSPGGSLARFQRKKLLILDLNGLLADITPVRYGSNLAHGKIRGKYVFIRPYHDDFLRFCFQNFELGVWSSRLKVNVDYVLDILMKDLRRHLLFCWDVSYCTKTKCNTLENQRKPLVLKELKKLWNKDDPDLPWEQGDFSPSNTLLVDDSPYKALGNPPHTAIFPQPYSYHNRTDNSLGPGGDIRMYLENLAAADDVQRYVQEHPFGQPFITESDPNWNFYTKILGRLENRDRLEKLAV